MNLTDAVRERLAGLTQAQEQEQAQETPAPAPSTDGLTKAQEALLEAVRQNPSMAAAVQQMDESLTPHVLAILSGETPEAQPETPVDDEDVDLEHYAEWLFDTFDGDELVTPAYKREKGTLSAWAAGEANRTGKWRPEWKTANREDAISAYELAVELARHRGIFHEQYARKFPDMVPASELERATASDSDEPEAPKGPTVTELGKPAEVEVPEPAQPASNLSTKAQSKLETAIAELEDAEHKLIFGGMEVMLPWPIKSRVRDRGERVYLSPGDKYILTAAFAEHILGGEVTGVELSLALGDVLGLKSPNSATTKRPQGNNHALSGYRQSETWLREAANALS